MQDRGAVVPGVRIRAHLRDVCDEPRRQDNVTSSVRMERSPVGPAKTRLDHTRFEGGTMLPARGETHRNCAGDEPAAGEEPPHRALSRHAVAPELDQEI